MNYNLICEFECDEGYLYNSEGDLQKCLCRVEAEAEIVIGLARDK